MSSTLKMPRPPQGNTFPTGNKLLQKRWDQRAYRMHVQKMRGMRAGLDNKTPKNYLHLQLRLKKIQAEEERQATIEHENRILLAKLTQVCRSHGNIDNWNLEHEPRSLNRPYMEKQIHKIEQENQNIMRRLTKISSYYKPDKWEDEYVLHQYYLQMKAAETKDYELYCSRTEGIESESEDEAEKTEKQHESEDESDADDETASAAPSKKKTEKSDKRPITKKQHTHFPLLGQERKKEEAKRKKEVAIARGQRYDEKGDAAILFKATKGMAVDTLPKLSETGNAESAVVKALARRRYKQRQANRQRFELEYELDLLEEIKVKLNEDWDDTIHALILEREEYDARCLQHALKGIGTLEATLIEILCTRNNAAISAIKTAYSDKYESDLMDDIKSDITDTAFRNLILGLAKGIHDEGGVVDKSQAQDDAKELFEMEEDERWNTESGKFNEIITDYSMAQMLAVLEEYAKLKEQKVTEMVANEFEGQMHDGISALVKCLHNCPGFLAGRIHESLTSAGDDSTLVRVVVTRSEVDLVQIKKIYKKRYGNTLEEDVQNKCKGSHKKVVLEIVKLAGYPKKGQQQQQQQWSALKQGNMKYQAPPKVKPLKRPPPSKKKAVDPDNPIMKTLKEGKPVSHPRSAKKSVKKGQDNASSRSSSSTSHGNKDSDDEK
ncbi:uncharacterized protein LOC100374557 [Saccoglossus kowalevskii]|uniref:Myosin-9-like n=1 Tax=Saccoglossus kowalevskii TaxID=10224 RepID=A0ABM0LU13_SACKO|nr:PREDICTED: myosin-9-like [Saccoglossus kowalevskii]